MADNLSQGPIQVVDNSPESINDALRQIQDRMDEMKGLRGRAVVHARVGVEDATADKDALNLQTSRTGTTLELGTLYLNDGTVLLPSLTFKNDKDTGAYRIGADNMGFAAGGVLVLDFNGTRVAIAVGLTVGGTLQVTGATTLSGDLDHDGTNIGFFGVAPAPRAAAYTISNVTTDRSYDANATTVDELADTLGTLIADLRTYGLVT